VQKAVIWFDRRMGPVIGTNKRVAKANILALDDKHNYDCWDTTRKIKVSATPRTERGTAHTPSSGVAETWLHETAVHESGYGDFALMSAVVGSDGVSLRRDDSKIRDEPCSPESL
jgi:hypothetical protein